MRRVLFSLSVMVAFGGMCTGGVGGDDLGADLVEPGAADAIEAEPAEPELAIPVDADDEAVDDCCCNVPEGEPRLETAAACAELGGECGDQAGCDAAPEGTTDAPAEATQAQPARKAPPVAGKVMTREDSIRSDEPRKLTRPGTTDGGSRKVVKPTDGDSEPKTLERR